MYSNVVSFSLPDLMNFNVFELIESIVTKKRSLQQRMYVVVEYNLHGFH